MRLIINIKNSTSKARKLILLNGLVDSKHKLPKGITGKVDFITYDSKKNSCTNTYDYYKLVEQLEYTPYCVKIFHTSNNRQIDFYTHLIQRLMMGVEPSSVPLEPGLTKEGNKRKERYSDKTNNYEYSPKWDSKKWNIADTKEIFILDNKIFFELKIKPKQKFRIIIDVEPKINIITGSYTGPPVEFKWSEK